MEVAKLSMVWQQGQKEVEGFVKVNGMGMIRPVSSLNERAWKNKG